MPATARSQSSPRHSETALAIRSYFGARFVEWSKQPRVRLGGVVTVDSGQLMAAVFNLCNKMRADGKLLDGEGDPRRIDGAHGLAALMGVDRKTAMRIFKGLEADGSMRSQEARDEKGYKQAAERWMQVPKAETLSPQSSATLDLGTPDALVPEVPPLSPRSAGPKSRLQYDPRTQHPYGRVEEGEEGVAALHGDKENVSLSADGATSGDINHDDSDDFWEGGNGPYGTTPAIPKGSEWSREGNAGLEAIGPDGEPCYAFLDRQRWDRVRRQLPHNSPLHIEDGRMVQVSACGSTLVFWFQYGYHRLKAMNDGPVLRRLVREELGDDIVVELRATAELLDMEPVAG